MVPNPRVVSEEDVCEGLMDVRLISVSEERVEFVLSGALTAFANAIRRAALSEIPKIAIDEINVYNNTSALFDEQLALRLALIPLRGDPSALIPKDECDCEDGCPRCQVLFTLMAEGPCMVHASDLVPADPSVVPAEPNVPIVELFEGQAVAIEAMARVGTGRRHAKWQVGVACGYKNMPKIEIGEACDGCGECVEVCPKHIIVMQGEKPAITDIVQCTMCKLCERACGVNAIKVGELEDVFVMRLESDRSYTAHDMACEAARIIKQRALSLSEQLEELIT